MISQRILSTFILPVNGYFLVWTLTHVELKASDTSDKTAVLVASITTC